MQADPVNPHGLKESAHSGNLCFERRGRAFHADAKANVPLGCLLCESTRKLRRYKEQYGEDATHPHHFASSGRYDGSSRPALPRGALITPALTNSSLMRSTAADREESRLK